MDVNEIMVSVKVDTAQLDELKEKAQQCKTLLQEIKELAGSLDLKISVNGKSDRKEPQSDHKG